MSAGGRAEGEGDDAGAPELVGSSPYRRVPQQARSRARVERLLDTAEAVFVEVGYDAATTNLIAARAGTSVGALYEFFADKQALARALAQRYLDELGRLQAEQVINDPGVEGEGIIGRAVDRFAAFWERHPGVAPLLRGGLGTPELAAAGATLLSDLVERIATIIDQRRPGLDPVRRLRIAGLAADLVRAGLERAQRQEDDERLATIVELKVAVGAYLGASLPRQHAPRP